MLQRMKFAVVVFSMAGVATIGAMQAGQKYGEGVALKDATSIKALYESPDKFLGKTVRIDGVVSEVCEEMGCWIAVAAKDAPEQTVRFKVEDGVIVFPVEARGKVISAEGVFEKIAPTDEHGMDAAKEQASKQTTPSEFTTKYQVKATGAVIK
jgi:hypothetical protein